MPESYHKVFTDKKKLTQMFKLRQEGWSLISLGLVFGVDFSSIHHLCKKYGIVKGENRIEFNPKNIIALVEIRVKKPKSYAEYLEEYYARNRRSVPIE